MPTELDWLTGAIIGEAGNQDDRGMGLVADVLTNRVLHPNAAYTYGYQAGLPEQANTYQGQLLGQWGGTGGKQFSSVWSTNPDPGGGTGAYDQYHRAVFNPTAIKDPAELARNERARAIAATFFEPQELANMGYGLDKNFPTYQYQQYRGVAGGADFFDTAGQNTKNKLNPYQHGGHWFGTSPHSIAFMPSMQTVPRKPSEFSYTSENIDPQLPIGSLYGSPWKYTPTAPYDPFGISPQDRQLYQTDTLQRLASIGPSYEGAPLAWTFDESMNGYLGRNSFGGKTFFMPEGLSGDLVSRQQARINPNVPWDYPDFTVGGGSRQGLGVGGGDTGEWGDYPVYGGSGLDTMGGHATYMARAQAMHEQAKAEMAQRSAAMEGEMQGLSNYNQQVQQNNQSMFNSNMSNLNPQFNYDPGWGYSLQTQDKSHIPIINGAYIY